MSRRLKHPFVLKPKGFYLADVWSASGRPAGVGAGAGALRRRWSTVCWQAVWTNTEQQAAQQATCQRAAQRREGHSRALLPRGVGGSSGRRASLDDRRGRGEAGTRAVASAKAAHRSPNVGEWAPCEVGGFGLLPVISDRQGCRPGLQPVGWLDKPEPGGGRRSSARHVDQMEDVRGGRRERRVPQDSGEVAASQPSVGELNCATTAHTVGSKSRREPAAKAGCSLTT